MRLPLFEVTNHEEPSAQPAGDEGFSSLADTTGINKRMLIKCLCGRINPSSLMNGHSKKEGGGVRTEENMKHTNTWTDRCALTLVKRYSEGRDACF